MAGQELVYDKGSKPTPMVRHHTSPTTVAISQNWPIVRIAQGDSLHSRKSSQSSTVMISTDLSLVDIGGICLGVLGSDGMSGRQIPDEITLVSH